jgi:hypothetical protein
MKAALDDLADSTKKPTITAPAPFKKDKKWRTWKEQFLAYLGSKWAK